MSDKIVTRETAKKVREALDEKYVIEGEYSPGTIVGTARVADNLTPYSNTSGVLQSQPFILQGTGCGNGESQVDTGTFCQIKAKRSNVVVPNQLSQIANNTEQLNNGITWKITDHIMTATGTATANVYNAWETIPLIAGHKYFINGTNTMLYLGGGASQNLTHDGDCGIVTCSVSGNYSYQWNIRTNVVANYKFRLLVIDLTQWFCGNNNIPNHLLSHPEDFYRYWQGSMDCTPNPTFQASNGRWLRSWGRNVWDEEWEVGGIDGSTGNNTTNPATIRSKNYIKVIPNAEYYYEAPYYCNVRYYDANKNYLGYAVWAKNSNNTPPSNVCFIRFILPSEYGTTYKNDITISLYYTGESGYNEHYPFKLLAEIDTGNEPLGAFDVKYPSGLIERKTIPAFNLGDLDFTLDTSYGTPYFKTTIDLAVLGKGNTLNIITTNGLTAVANLSAVLATNNTMSISSYGNTLNIRCDAYATASAFKTAMDGVMIQYEPANPTTEQGTPFPENMPINDFGTMGSDTTAIPQAYDIFYPVDYKGGLDTLYNHLEGDFTNVAKSDEVEVALESKQDAIIPDVPTENGTYILKATYTNGTITYTWVAEE